jgi:hypothetical protein
MTGRLRPLAALAVAAVIGVGCSSESGEDGNANAAYETAVKFSDCMRENGVREFPDPDASGELTIDGVLNGSSIDSEAPAWKAAMAACKDLEPSGFTGDHDVSAEEQQRRLEFAQCIRDNGVKDFPDPAKDAPLVDTRRIPSSAEPGGMSILNAAMQKCGDRAEKAMGR